MDFSSETPYLTTDGIIEIHKGGTFKGIVLIERKNEPKGMALPGGFVDVGKTVENALIREMKEETNLDVTINTLHVTRVFIQPVWFMWQVPRENLKAGMMLKRQKFIHSIPSLLRNWYLTMPKL